MASIRKRGKVWQVQVRKRGHLPQTKTFALKVNAEAWARKIETEIERGIIGPGFRRDDSVTLAELLVQYRDKVSCRKRSYKHEANRISRLISMDMSRMAAVNVGPQHIAEFRDQRLRVVGSQAVRHDLNVLSQVYNTAIREWNLGLYVNPVAGLWKPQISASRQRRLTALEASRLQAALYEADADFRDFVRVALNTGMRRGEVLRIRHEDIQSAGATLIIPVTKNGLSRIIPLCTDTQHILNARMSTFPGALFPFAESWARYHWDKLVQRAGISDLHFHDLRHEAISRFFERGLSVPEVALISGHKDYRMLARYTHLRAEDVAKKIA